MLKYQRFEDSGNKKTELCLKYQQLDTHDNEKGESLDKFEGKSKGKNIRYFLLFFIALLLFHQK